MEGEHFRYFHSVLSCRSALHCALSQIITWLTIMLVLVVLV